MFMSRSLTPAEQRYGPSELEVAALVLRWGGMLATFLVEEGPEEATRYRAGSGKASLLSPQLVSPDGKLVLAGQNRACHSSSECCCDWLPVGLMGS